jgi:predicted transcriptional regulator
MSTLNTFTIKLDAELAARLAKAAGERGWSPESLAADCVAQHIEIALRHRVLVERMEAVDAQIATLAQFVGDATQDSAGLDLSWICKYGRKPK